MAIIINDSDIFKIIFNNVNTSDKSVPTPELRRVPRPKEKAKPPLNPQAFLQPSVVQPQPHLATQIK